jgi:hypothetical protein
MEVLHTNLQILQETLHRSISNRTTPSYKQKQIETSEAEGSFLQKLKDSKSLTYKRKSKHRPT